VVVDRVNQVWATDITYIPMSRGFREQSRSAGVNDRLPLCP